MAAEVMSEDHHLLVEQSRAAVLQAFGWGGAQGIEGENFGRHEFAVEAVAHGIGADRRDHQPHCIDLFAAM
jgi:hypothetical protein